MAVVASEGECKTLWASRGSPWDFRRHQGCIRLESGQMPYRAAGLCPGAWPGVRRTGTAGCDPGFTPSHIEPLSCQPMCIA